MFFRIGVFKNFAMFTKNNFVGVSYSHKFRCCINVVDVPFMSGNKIKKAGTISLSAVLFHKGSSFLNHLIDCNN